jgi:hypothetical protein
MRIRNPEGGREEGRRRGRGSGLRTRGQLRQQRAGPGGGAHRRVQGSTVVIYILTKSLSSKPGEYSFISFLMGKEETRRQIQCTIEMLEECTVSTLTKYL